MLFAVLSVTLPGCATWPASWTLSARSRPAVVRDASAARAENERGLTRIAENDWDGAAERFRAAVDENAGLAAGWNNLGITYLNTGKYYDAAWAFQTAARIAPNTIEPKVNLGLLFETVGWRDRAVEAYESALRIQPNDETITNHLARARVQGDAQSATLRSLLERLAGVVRDTDWAQWARERLARGSESPDKRTTGDAP